MDIMPKQRKTEKPYENTFKERMKKVNEQGSF